MWTQIPTFSIPRPLVSAKTSNSSTQTRVRGKPGPETDAILSDGEAVRDPTLQEDQG
jgi:hypothetical protein